MAKQLEEQSKVINYPLIWRNKRDGCYWGIVLDAYPNGTGSLYRGMETAMLSDWTCPFFVGGDYRVAKKAARDFNQA
jgi:hypothetical protein